MKSLYGKFQWFRSWLVFGKIPVYVIILSEKIESLISQKLQFLILLYKKTGFGLRDMQQKIEP